MDQSSAWVVLGGRLVVYPFAQWLTLARVQLHLVTLSKTANTVILSFFDFARKFQSSIFIFLVWGGGGYGWIAPIMKLNLGSVLVNLCFIIIYLFDLFLLLFIYLFIYLSLTFEVIFCLCVCLKYASDLRFQIHHSSSSSRSLLS